MYQENNIDEGSEASVKQHILKCYEDLKPDEREQYEELSQLLIDRARKSGSSFHKENHLDAGYIEKCKKDLKFPTEMLMPAWILNRIGVGRDQLNRINHKNSQREMNDFSQSTLSINKS